MNSKKASSSAAADSSLIFVKKEDCVDMDVLVTSTMNADSSSQTIIFDTTASETVSRSHVSWLRNGHTVITANNLALSNAATSKELHSLIRSGSNNNDASKHGEKIGRAHV